MDTPRYISLKKILNQKPRGFISWNIFHFKSFSQAMETSYLCLLEWWGEGLCYRKKDRVSGSCILSYFYIFYMVSVFWRICHLDASSGMETDSQSILAYFHTVKPVLHRDALPMGAHSLCTCDGEIPRETFPGVPKIVKSTMC